MKKLVFATALALAAASQAQASQSTAWWLDRFACTLSNSQTKLFINVSETYSGTAALQNPPYYQKTQFSPIRFVTKSSTVFSFYFGADIPKYVELHKSNFVFTGGHLRPGLRITGKLMVQGKRFDVTCTRN